MPIHSGKDSKGPFIQWGHQKKYYYKSGNKKSLEAAKSKAKKQMSAIFANGYIKQSKFLKLYQQIILETKQQFSLIDNKEDIIKGLNKAIQWFNNGQEIQEIIDDDSYLLTPIYTSLRYKSKFITLNNELIDENLLMNFYLEVTKNAQSFDNISSNWISFLYPKNPDFYQRKTYSKYITPNIQYNSNDLIMLQNALIKLQNITEKLSIQNNTNLAFKYNINFNQYFTQNDNIKLYCFKKEDIYLLDQIETEFLNLLQNKENNRIYKFGIDDGWSFGEQIAKKIVKDILFYLFNNKTTSEETFESLNNNFEQLIKKYSNQIIQKD